jgi:hypothetical protein
MTSPDSERDARTRLIALVVGAAAAAVVPLIAAAQPDDPAAPFLDTWSGVFTTQDNPYWRLEDFVCFPGCPPAARDYLTQLLADPANDKVPAQALFGQATGYAGDQLRTVLTPLGREIQDANSLQNDPKLRCEPYGFVREIPSALPMKIHRDGDMLVIQYEEWSLLRIIYLDGRPHPEHETPSLLGHSVGHFEDGALVVDTTNINPGWISDFSHGGHSGKLRVTERYEVRDEPRRLELTMTLVDPDVLTQPYTIVKTWLSTPDVELLQDSCADYPGKF